LLPAALREAQTAGI